MLVELGRLGSAARKVIVHVEVGEVSGSGVGVGGGRGRGGGEGE